MQNVWSGAGAGILIVSFGGASRFQSCQVPIAFDAGCWPFVLDGDSVGVLMFLLRALELSQNGLCLASPLSQERRLDVPLPQKSLQKTKRPRLGYKQFVLKGGGGGKAFGLSPLLKNGHQTSLLPPSPLSCGCPRQLSESNSQHLAHMFWAFASVGLIRRPPSEARAGLRERAGQTIGGGGGRGGRVRGRSCTYLPYDGCVVPKAKQQGIPSGKDTPILYAIFPTPGGVGGGGGLVWCLR